MPLAAAQPRASVSARNWLILALLVLSVSINYVDRGNLSIAAAMGSFRREMNLGDAGLGVLFSAFAWTYAPLQVLAGYLIDKRGAVRVFTIGFLIWSVATVFTGFAGGFASLLMLRLLLGTGEAVAYPAYSKIIAAGFPEHRRGTANALIDAGSRTGPAIGVMLGGAIAVHYGWRAMFFVVGGASLLWLVPWMFVARSVPAAPPSAETSSPGLGAILRLPQAWGTFGGLFCVNYTWTFILAWLPSYLTRERHYTTEMMSIYGSLPFWGMAAMCAVFGVFSDRLIARGADRTRVRIGFVAGGLALSTLMLPACLVSNQVLSMALLITACLSFGVVSSNFWAITQTLAGPHAVGQWTGCQNGFGNLAGIFAPYLSGVLVAATGSFIPAFIAAAAASVVGSALYLFVVRRVEPVDWNQRPAGITLTGD
jgi:MFS transporter, ACS family, D-galactonate transporter